MEQRNGDARRAPNSQPRAAGCGAQPVPFDTAALEAYLRQNIPRLSGPMTIAPVDQGGQSNPTYFVTFGERQLVLRKKPPGDILPSAHAVDREYRVLAALHDSAVPVPPVLLFQAGDGIVGTPFYVMERVHGRIFADCALPEAPAAQRIAIYGAAAEALARIHGIDIARAGLSDFGKHGGYYARQIGRWSKQWQLSAAAPDDNFAYLTDWLHANMPAKETTALVHGDFRIGNLIYHPQDPRVAAVLDWELSTLGDPLADLAHACVYSWFMTHDEFGGLADQDLGKMQLPSLGHFVHAYFDAARRTPDIELFHLAFALFRNAAIFEGIAARARAGNAAAPNAAKVGQLAPVLAARAVRLIESGSIDDILQETGRGFFAFAKS